MEVAPHAHDETRAGGAQWLAVAVATLWLLSVGGEAEETITASTVQDVTALIPEQPRMRSATRLRLVSVFRRGWNLILVELLEQAPLPMGRCVQSAGQRLWSWRSRTGSCRTWRCRWLPEVSGGRSNRNMHEGKNMGIMATFKEPCTAVGLGRRQTAGIYHPATRARGECLCTPGAVVAREDREDLVYERRAISLPGLRAIRTRTFVQQNGTSG